MFIIRRTTIERVIIIGRQARICLRTFGACDDPIFFGEGTQVLTVNTHEMYM